MDALEQARAEIDTVDAQLAALFERRMAAVLQVAEYKRAHGLPVYDAARETAVLEKAAARIQDPALRPYYKDHVQNLMDVAKQYEAVVLGQNRAAYQGVEGAFAHIALRALFPHAEAVSYPTWDEVFDAVERGDAARGVVPFENSHAGDVSAVLDLCYNHPALWVVDVYDLPISQNLLVLPGTKLDQIKSVYSHQQAIAQSETFLRQFGLPATAMANTAMAAKFVAESGDSSKAAIASVETAALYGLEVLVPSINTDGDNTTRFIVLSREKPTGGNRFSLLFTVDNKPGKLGEVIQIIGASGFNMESIKSRPMPHVPFEYYFYVELVGDPTADETAALFAGDQAHGALRVGALDVALANHLPQRLARYRRESPGVELHIRPEHSLLLERLLMEGELDLIVTDGPIEHPLLASRLAFRERLLRVTPADLPAPTPEDLASLELYVFGHTCHYRRQVDRWLAESGIQPRATLEIESYPSLFACIEAGLGFACVPESFVARMPSARRGFHAEPVAGLDSSDIHFVWRKQQASPLIQGFIDSIGAD